jgi:hypothetical protein
LQLRNFIFRTALKFFRGIVGFAEQTAGAEGCNGDATVNIKMDGTLTRTIDLHGRDGPPIDLDKQPIGIPPGSRVLGFESDPRGTNWCDTVFASDARFTNK